MAEQRFRRPRKTARLNIRPNATKMAEAEAEAKTAAEEAAVTDRGPPHRQPDMGGNRPGGSYAPMPKPLIIPAT